MIFQKPAPKLPMPMVPEDQLGGQPVRDEIETVVGPSVNVEGDFVSEGNIVVKGSVAGSVTTSKHLLIEQGARVVANVRAGSVKISGDLKGNMKIRESLELTATARVIGDVEVKVLVMEAGALLYGKVAMLGIDGVEGKPGRSGSRGASKRSEEFQPLEIIE